MAQPMRRRVFLFLGLTFLVMLALIAAATRWVLVRSFADLERSSLERDVERVRGALAADLESLGRTAGDWATWDETYRFAETGSNEFIDQDLETEMIARLGISAVLMVNTAGETLFGKAVNPTTGRAFGFPVLLAGFIASHPAYAHHADKDSAVSGLELLGSEAALVVSRPIVDSRRLRPVRGALVMARILDPEAIATIGQRVSLSISMLPIDDPTVPPALASLKRPLIQGIGRDRVVVYALLESRAGTPAVALRIDEPAEIRARGTVVLVTVLAWVLLTGAGFALAMLMFLERFVLSRLHALSASVLAIGTSDDPARRVEARGRDEIAYLGAAINGMLESIERSTVELRRAEERDEAFLAAVPDLFFRISREGTIVDARLPIGLSGLPPSNRLIGTNARDLPAAYSPVTAAFVEKGLACVGEAIATGLPQTITFSLPADGGASRTYECRVAAKGDEAVALVRDVTERELAEEARRREILLREIHHRVKNNLQVITSLLALQARSVDDPRLRRLLSETRNRVRSMAVIHEKLYEAGPGRVGFADYLRDLVQHVRHGWEGESRAVEVSVDVEPVALDQEVAVPCGLVVNELLTNALKHAFPPGAHGKITVSLARGADERLRLQVADNGVGAPEGLDLKAPSSLGLRIVAILAEQLKGTIDLERPEGGGASFTLTFPG